MGLTTAQLVTIRAIEERDEAGTVDEAINAVMRQIRSPEAVPQEIRFMRKVLSELEGMRDLPAEFHDDVLGQGRR